MSEAPRLFIDLPPPAGGLQRLQQQLHAPHAKPRAKAWIPLGVGALAMALLAIVVIPGLVERQRSNDALTQALRQAIAPAPSDHAIHVIDGGALELPSGQANVRLYLVQSAIPATPVNQP